MKRNLILIAVFSILTQPGMARATLKVGDPAPPLTIAKWVKGESVNPQKASKDEVFVIEFWATWCGPCKAGMPHLSEMQEHFKDMGVTFVGISQEQVGVVKKFLRSGWDKKMRYTVAVDKNGRTNTDWMRAAGQNGIPCAFVVKDGKIKWIGHPMNGLDMIVADLCGDKKYAKAAKEKKTLQDQYEQAAQAKNWKEAVAAADKLMALDDGDFTIRLRKFHILSKQMGDEKAAKRFGRELIKQWKDKQDLCKFAEMLLLDEGFAGKKDVKLATAAAKKAAKLSHVKDPVCLRAYAMALAESGKYKKAVKWQKKAIKLAKDDRQLNIELRKTLKEYEKKLKAKES